MKICFDGLSISQLHSTGLYSYTYEILDNLFNVYPQPDYKIIWDNSSYIDRWKKHNNLSYINLKLNRIKNDYRELEKYIDDNNITLFHSTNNGLSIPNKKLCKNVITVHDLLPINNTKYVDKKYLNKFNSVFNKSLDISDKIIAVSKFIKNELINNLNISEEKIDVIYPGISKNFRLIDETISKNYLKDVYKITDDFILYVGSIHTRKNLDLLFKIFKEINKISDKIKLVIVGKYSGKREDYYLKLKTLGRELNIGQSVIFTGDVTYLDMPYFYSASKCIFNLSDYEGFPITALEAIGSNKPIICSKAYIFKEVFGNKGLLVDPNNISEIKDIVLNLIYNENYYNEILNNQLELVNKFDLNDSIISLVKIYESIAYGN